MGVYDYSRVATSYLIPQTRTTTSDAGKFLNENLPVETTDGVSFLGTKGAGDDCLVTQQTFINEVKRLVLAPFLKTLIGSTKDNFNNQNKDDLVFRDSYFEYLLMDGRGVTLADYPELGAILGYSADFNLPNVLGRFEKNNIVGGSNLGTTGEDSIKSFSLTSEQVKPTTQPHNHTITGLFAGFGSGGTVQTGGGQGKESYNGGQTTSVSTVGINPFTVTSNYNGGSETQPKHILKQKYIIAKVLI
jgi:hypothetical protein